MRLTRSEFENLEAHRIRLVVFDVDGVLTDGGMYYTEGGDQFKKFNTKDGMGIKMLIEKGYTVGFLSSGSTERIVHDRAATLGVEKVYSGPRPKLQVLNEWCTDLGITLREVAYLGDDLNDLEVLPAVGLSACPSDAVDAVRMIVKLVLGRRGGDACAREFCDILLH